MPLVIEQISAIHRQLESFPQVKKFLSTLQRNSHKTATGYKTSLAYFQEYLSKYHNCTLEDLIPRLSNKEFDVYSLLDEFIGFIQIEKKISTSSVNQYFCGIKSYLGYFEVDIVPSRFKRRVKLPKVYLEEEQAIDAKDIREILLNCHNRKLKAFLLVLASGGLRAVEACAIRLSDIDFSNNPTKIHVRKEYAKTRVARDIYISDEASKYLKDWITYKYGDTFREDIFNRKNEKTDSCLVFQVQLNNLHVIPSSIYIKILQQFHDLLKLAGFSERKEGMKRRKITLHSFRRFVKTTISDCIGKEYSEWFLGHAKSSYYVSKPDVRAATYAEKCMRYLTFLDYTTLEATGKNIEAKLSEKEKEIQLLRQRDSMNTDAIAGLSDRMTKMMQEIEILKQQKFS